MGSAVMRILLPMALLMAACSTPSPDPVASGSSTPSAAPPSGSPSAPAWSCAENPSPAEMPEGWTGPVRTPSASVTTSIQDGDDSARGYVDLEQVRTQDPRYPAWTFNVASRPPTPTTLDPCTVLSYGLAFDTTRDGDADYLVGIGTDVGEPATTREWVTNLATGETEENRTMRKGTPFDIGWFGESGPRGHRLLLTFLGGWAPDGVDDLRGAAPAGVDATTPFYAWASVEENGQVVAWDYAPDAAWLSR